MRQTKIPIENLVSYIKRNLKSQENIYDNLMSLIDEFYCLFSEKETIIPAGGEKTIMPGWCD